MAALVLLALLGTVHVPVLLLGAEAAVSQSRSMLKEKQLPAGLAPFENVPSSLVRAANQTQALPSALGLGSSRKLSSTTSQSNRKRKGRGKRPKIMDEPYAGLTEEQWTARVIQARSRLEDILSHPTFRKRQEGKQRRPRGIVIPAGGNVLLTNAFMVISVLREMHRCTLPIEVFYNGAREMDEKTNHYFESRFKNVTLFDLSTAPYPSHHRRIPIDHYTFKAYAFYHSSFDQVLLLDADSIPLRDPEYLYDTPQFLEAGHLNWPDWWYDNLPGFGWPLEAYALFGLAPPQMGPHVLQGSEAGQTLLDRRRHWEVLEWYWFANTHGPDGLYKWMWYDKEALQLAFSLAGRADLYHQVTRYPREALCKGPATLREYAHVGILQHDPYGRPAFLHQAGSLQKFDPSKDFPYQPNFVSVPLNQLRAIKLFPDAVRNTPGELGLSGEDVRVDEACQPAYDMSEPEAAELEAARAAGRTPRVGADRLRPQTSPADRECGVDLRTGDMPVPVMRTERFDPHIMRVFEFAMKAFAEIRAEFAAGRVLSQKCRVYDLNKGIVCDDEVKPSL